MKKPYDKKAIKIITASIHPVLECRCNSKNTITNLLKTAHHFLILSISMAGYVPKNGTILRTIAMVSSFIIAIYLGNCQPNNSNLAISYFLLTEVLYLSFITIVLSENGLRHWFIRKWGNEDDGYLTYEAILGFLFFIMEPASDILLRPVRIVYSTLRIRISC